MAIPSRQIGQSNEANLLWNISKQLEKLTAVSATMGPYSIISQTITCGVINKVPSEDAVCQALGLKQDTLISGTNIKTINGDSILGPGNIVVTSGSGVIVVANYSALPPPSTVTGKFYWCENSQGTSWLPGPLGGTYYPAGTYYSNGVTWEYAATPYQATQVEVNAGTNTDKFVSPYTLYNSTQWGTKENSLGNPSVNGYVLSSTTGGTRSWVAQATGTTNLNYTPFPTYGSVTSSTGTSATIPLADNINAGLFSPSEKTKLSNISVGLSMPAAFTVTNSPITTAGTIAVTGAGLASQYIRGDGQLASFPDIAGGGGGQVYYCNGGTSQGTINTTNFYQLSTAANLSTSANFTSGTVNDVAFANFITDIGKPTQETVPAGVWIFQCYLSASATNVLQVYATVEVYNGSTFYVLATSLVEVITNGTTIDLYTFTCAVPEYTPLATADRIAIRFYPKNLSGGNTITLYTQNSNLSSIQTTFTTGLASLNGLTSASQLLATGTTGNDFNIDSTNATHTFNIPNASSAANRRGLLIANDWTTFNNKQNSSTRQNASDATGTINYCGVALGTLVLGSAAAWTVRKLVISSAGTVTTYISPVNSIWNNYASLTYTLVP